MQLLQNFEKLDIEKWKNENRKLNNLFFACEYAPRSRCKFYVRAALKNVQIVLRKVIGAEKPIKLPPSLFVFLFFLTF